MGRVARGTLRRVRAERLEALGGPLVRAWLQAPPGIRQESALWQPGQRGHQGPCQAQWARSDVPRQHGERPWPRLIDAYQQEIMTLPALSTRREPIAPRLKGCEQERHPLAQQHDTTIKWERMADTIGPCRALLGRNLDRCSYEDRQAVIQLVVDKGVVSPEGAVAVHHVWPFEEPPVVTDQKKKGPQVKFMSCD